jgi:CRP/FNR family transcriptional regulator, cyclic AMP receptor protein
VTLEQEVDLLRNIPLFAKIEPAKLKLLAFTSERLVFRVADVLFRQGDVGDAAYIIIEGDADVSVAAAKGSLKVARLGKNDIVGEIAILCDVPRTATVTAASELTALKVSKDLFLRMVGEFPQIGVEVMRVLARRLERTTSDLREASAKLAQAGLK